jgi:glutamate racemase
VEAGETSGPGVDYFLRRYLDPLFARPQPPTRLLLGCTHYPLLLPGIRAVVPGGTEVLAQGDIVAERLADWLARHPEMEPRLGRGGSRRYLTTDDPTWFSERGAAVLGQPIHTERVHIPPP